MDMYYNSRTLFFRENDPLYVVDVYGHKFFPVVQTAEELKIIIRFSNEPDDALKILSNTSKLVFGAKDDCLIYVTNSDKANSLIRKSSGISGSGIGRFPSQITPVDLVKENCAVFVAAQCDTTSFSRRLYPGHIMSWEKKEKFFVYEYGGNKGYNAGEWLHL
jgi:hypothetical protein